MPLKRYFLYVGGVLLALLFILDEFLPRFPVAERQVPAYVIRLHSDRKWPERVVYDTSLPTIVPAQIAAIDTVIPAPMAETSASAQANAREAFAQTLPTAPDQLGPPAPKRRQATHQRDRRIAKKSMPRIVLVARQPHFGWFGNRIW